MKDNFLQETFNVALWTKNDIKMVIDNSNDYEITISELHTFINDVILYLNDSFDASIGINWDVIEDAVSTVYEDYLIK